MAAPARGQSVTFQRIADNTTPMPGSGSTTFNLALGPPSLDNGSVAFFGQGGLAQGTYTNVSGSLVLVANNSTPIPGGTGNFLSFGFPPVLSNGTVAFDGSLPSGADAGLYWNLGGPLAAVVDRSTPVPGGTGNFTSFGAPALSNNMVGFRGSNGNGVQSGIYTRTGTGPVTAAVDLNTPIPGGTGNFTGFNTPPAVSDGNVAFFGGTGSGSTFQGASSASWAAP
jgi:hypothetical protein